MASPQRSFVPYEYSPISSIPMRRGPPPCRPLKLRAGRDVSQVTWKALRLLVIERDKGTCAHCGQHSDHPAKGPDGRTWHVDHVVPLIRGGSTVEGNLVLSCGSCNSHKGSSAPGSPWQDRSRYLRQLEQDKKKRLDVVPVGYITGPRTGADATRDAVWSALLHLHALQQRPIRIRAIADRSGFTPGAVMRHLRIAALNGYVRQHEKPLAFEPLQPPAAGEVGA